MQTLEPMTGSTDAERAAALSAKDNECIAWLRARNYVVTLPDLGPWETVKGCWERLRPEIAYETFSDRLRAFAVLEPGTFPVKQGPSGRVTRFRLTPALKVYLCRKPAAGNRQGPGHGHRMPRIFRAGRVE